MPVPRRSDARRNRAEILRLASEALVAKREMLPLQRVARLAGLASATVYRHFSDQNALAVGVMEQQLDVLARVVAEHEDDPAAFRWLLRAVLESEASLFALVGLVRRFPERQQLAFVARLVRILDGPFQRARDAGLLRGDLDLNLLLRLQLSMLEAAIAVAPDRAQSAIDLMLDGIFVPSEAGQSEHSCIGDHPLDDASSGPGCAH